MELQELVAGCRAAVGTEDPVAKVVEVMREFISQPDLAGRLGPGDRSSYDLLHRDADLTVVHTVAPPISVASGPHDHRMWAVIGTYQGCEENRLFARANDGLEVVEEFQLRAGDVRVLDADAIHSVQITSDDYLGAVHVYGGDLLGVPRSSWDADGVEQVYASSGPKLFEVARHHEERLGRGLTSAEIVAFLAAARSG